MVAKNDSTKLNLAIGFATLGLLGTIFMGLPQILALVGFKPSKSVEESMRAFTFFAFLACGIAQLAEAVSAKVNNPNGKVVGLSNPNLE